MRNTRRILVTRLTERKNVEGKKGVIVGGRRSRKKKKNDKREQRKRKDENIHEKRSRQKIHTIQR